MTAQVALTTLMGVAPDVVNRVNRFEMAVRLLRSGMAERDVRQRIQEHYGCSRRTAWYDVSKARDIV